MSRDVYLRHFDRPRETLYWAKEAIEELDAIFSEFLGSENMRLVREPYRDTEYHCLKIKALTPAPSGLRRKATEALNNIRHSFDQSLHAACVALGKPRPNTNFPWRQNPGEVEGYLRSKDIPAELWEVIKREEPYKRSDRYPGGDDFLRALAKLANGKHTIGIRIIPQVREHAQPLVEGKFVLIPEQVWDPVENEQVVAIGPSDMKVKGNYTVVLSVAFDEPAPLHDQALAWGLTTFHAKAHKVLDSLETRCIELLGIK